MLEEASWLIDGWIIYDSSHYELWVHEGKQELFVDWICLTKIAFSNFIQKKKKKFVKN